MPSASTIAMSLRSAAARRPALIARYSRRRRSLRPKPVSLSRGSHNKILRLQRALCVDIARIERGAAADIQPVAQQTAENDVGGGLRDMDLAEQLALRTVAAHPVFLRVGPAHAAPDIAVDIAAHAVRE